MDNPIYNEAHRQLTICNACRYCEGYCSVFPSLHDLRTFSSSDITQFANLCHNCQACHYACQYADPHEFCINIPAALANVRVKSWQDYIRPRKLAEWFQHYGLMIGIMLVVILSLFMMLVSGSSATQGEGFYAFMPHQLMALIFGVAFIAPLVIIADAIRRYWRDVGGRAFALAELWATLFSAGRLDNLSGGQGQGCNYEKEDRFSDARRRAHHFTMYGFLLCFASTCVGTLMHYMLGMPAPYSWYELPKLLGVPGGCLLVVGCTWLAALKLKADPALGAVNVWGAEMAFVILLGLTGLTGLILYLLSGTGLVAAALIIHLACVFTFFILMPYSKMVHGFFRMAALARNAQRKGA